MQINISNLGVVEYSNPGSVALTLGFPTGWKTTISPSFQGSDFLVAGTTHLSPDLQWERSRAMFLE